jgi:hypothetical protein
MPDAPGGAAGFPSRSISFYPMAHTLWRLAYNLRFPAVAAAGLALGYGIWAGNADAAGPNRLIVPFWTDHATTARVYYDRGQGLSEADSASQNVPSSTGLRDQVFPLPLTPLREIRFDPSEEPGHFKIGQPRLESASGRFVAKFPITAVAPRNQIAEFHREGNVWLGTTTSDANDPQLTFQLGGPLRVSRPHSLWLQLVLLVVVAVAAWRTKRPPEVAKTER